MPRAARQASARLQAERTHRVILHALIENRDHAGSCRAARDVHRRTTQAAVLLGSERITVMSLSKLV